MKRLLRKSRVGLVALVAALVAFTIVTVLPTASAEPAEENIEVMSSEAVIIDTTHKGDVDKVRVVTFFELKGDGDTDVSKEMSLDESGKWQGVQGFETPVVEGDYLVWKGLDVDGNRNVLSSTQLSEEMANEVKMRIPLDIEYIYEFNGKIIQDPNEITGQDGHFKLTLVMENTSDEMTELEYEDPDTGELITEEVETYLPLVILPYDWYFDNSVFFNLEADPTGVVVPLPEYYQLGWSIPLFPPTSEKSNMIWVEADVKDFALPPLVLSANFIFPQTNQTDPIPQFVFGLEMLYDGVKQLHAGLTEGVEGLGSADTEDTLLYGTDQVLGGLKQMAANFPEMLAGVDMAVAGIGSPGTPDTLMYAMDQSALGLMQMVAGIGGPDVTNSAIWAMDQMIVGLDGMVAGIGGTGQPDTLLYGVSEASSGLQQMKAGIGSASTPDSLLFGMDQIGSGLLQMKTGLGAATTPDTMLYAVAQVQGGLTQMKEGIGDRSSPSLLYGVDQVQQGLDQVLSGIDEMSQGVSSGSSSDPGLLEGIQELRAGLAEMYAGTAEDGELRQALGLIRIMAPWTGPLVDQLENGIIFGDADNPSLHGGLGLMIDGADQLIAGIGSANTDGTLLNGLYQMAMGIDNPDPSELDLMYALEALANGLASGDQADPGFKEAIGSAATPDTLLFGLDQMAEGLQGMLDGIGSAGIQDTLLFGVVQIEKGLKDMADGIGTTGADNTLLYAMDAMADGLEQMKEGIGSATTADTLAYAIAQVQAGMEEMKAGVGAEGAPDTLLYAMAQVQHGLFQMKAGLSTGNMNDPGLKEGLMMISSGLGSASTPDTLLYGADQVSSGTEQVKEGLVQATDEGTTAILEGLAMNLAELYLTEAQLEAVEIRGEEFDHIIGRADDAENNLALIYQTPPTYNYEQGSKVSWIVAGIISLVIALALLALSRLRKRPVIG